MIVLSADIGGGSIRAARVDNAGTILDRSEAPTPPEPQEGYATLRHLWRELGPAGRSAVVIAGGLREGTGELTQSPNLPAWEGTRPGDELGCIALNDANGALLGEALSLRFSEIIFLSGVRGELAQKTAECCGGYHS